MIYIAFFEKKDINILKSMGAPKGNKNALGNEGGRTAWFKTPKELQNKIDEYFNNCPDKKKVISDGMEFELPVFTICGLALYLGFSTRKSFYDYSHKIEFVNIIKKAQLRIEQCYETNLHFSNPTGSIFALKNMGWKDNMEFSGIPQGVNINVNSRENSMKLQKFYDYVGQLN